MFNLLQKIKNNYVNNYPNDNDILNNPNITLINTNCNTFRISILVIKDALESKDYDILNNEYISVKDIFLLDKRNNPFLNPTKMMINNFIYTIDARRELNNNIISDNWKSFINYHLSNDFYEQLIILTKYSKSYKNIISRNKDVKNNVNTFLNLNCISPINYFNSNSNLNIKEINSSTPFLGWFFLKKDNDTSIGGNLTILKKTIKNTLDNDSEEKKNKNEPIISVPYEKNTFIIIAFENINQNLTPNPTQNDDNIKLYYEFESRNITFHSQRYIEFGYKNKK